MQPKQFVTFQSIYENVLNIIQELQTNMALDGQPVYHRVIIELLDSFPVFLLSTTMFLVVGVTKGVYDGLKTNAPTVLSRVSQGMQSLFESLPDFFIICSLVLLTILLWTHGFPNFPLVEASGFWRGTFIPAGIAGILPAMYMARMVRLKVTEQYGQPYLQTAQSKGIQNSRVLLHHLLPNLYPSILHALLPGLGMMMSGFLLVDYLLVRDNGFLGGALKAVGVSGSVTSSTVGLSVSMQPFDSGLVLIYLAVGAVVVLLIWSVVWVLLSILGYRGIQNPYTSQLRERTGATQWTLYIGMTMFTGLLVLGCFANQLHLPNPFAREEFEVFGLDDIRMPAFPPFTPHHLLGTDAWGGDILSQVIYGIWPTFCYLGACSLAILTVSTGLALLGGVVRIRLIRGIISFLNGLFTLLPAVLGCLLVLEIPDVFWHGAYINGATHDLTLGITHAVVFGAVLCFTEIGRVSGTLLFLIDDAYKKTFIEASETLGTSSWGTFRRHILRSYLETLLEQATVVFSRILILTATLGFLGFSPSMYWDWGDNGLVTRFISPDWASIIAQNAHDWFRYQWVPFGPALAIGITALSLNLIRMGLLNRIQTTPKPSRPWFRVPRKRDVGDAFSLGSEKN